MDLEATACSQRGCAERHDFLPFTCNGCNKKFCLDHHKSEQHSCPVPSRDDKYAPTCPMCQQAVTIKPGENANQVIDAHIRAGCQVVTAKSKKNPCSFAGCKEKEFIPVSCKLCKQPFCLKHRFETDHPCPKNGNTKGNGGGLFKAPPAKAAAGAAAVARAAVPAKPTFEQHRKKQVQQQDDLRVARAAQYHDHLTASQQAHGSPARGGSQQQMYPSPGGAPQQANGRPGSAQTSVRQEGARAVGAMMGAMGMSQTSPQAARGGAGANSQARRGKDKHSNTPQDPAGAAGIPASEKMMLSVYFPVASRRKPEFHVLSIRWSVGKCIDTLAARGALHNLNNVPGAPRLALFNKAGARLGVAGSLEQCVISGMLEGGDPVVLEFGEMLESFDPKKLKSVKEASGSDCSIQ